MSSTNNRILINTSKVIMNRPPLVIGRGAMGEVYLASYLGEDVVVKKSQRDIDNTLLKEYSNYFKLQDHCNILKFYGVIKDDRFDRYSFSLVLEYAPNGNLSSYLKTNTVDWCFKARVCRDIAVGLMHCHDNNILHFDLKPENVLLDRYLTPKLADFGISKTKSQMILDSGKAGGTINYVAPERVSRDIKMREFFESHPKLSDIYSFGLILWSVAKDGEHPYEGMDDEDIKEQKRSAHSIYRLLNQLPESTPQNYNQLIFDLANYNPGERLHLTIALIELESLFGDGEEEHREYIEGEQGFEDSLCIPESSSDDIFFVNDKIRESAAGSELTSTSTMSDSTLPSDKEINVYGGRLAEPLSREVNHENKSSSAAKQSSIPIRKQSRPSRQSSGSESSKKDDNFKAGNILNRSLVASPTPNMDRIEIPKDISDPSLECDSIIKDIINRKISISCGNSGIYKHSKHDSGVDGIDQKSQVTLVNSSPVSPKNPIFDLESKLSAADISLINDVIAICNNWEKYTDDLMKRKLEVLCHEKGIKPENLLEVLEKSQLRSTDYYFIIGFMSEHAFGKAKDPRMAFECYFKAADLGDSRGLVYIGWCYYKGMGTPKDPQKAFTCFQRAANNGCVSAYNNLGWCFDIGFGTSTNPYKAFECFKTSAEKGYATAQCRVGVCYEYGRGTHKDLEKALEWYTKAADNGHNTAKRRVNELSKLVRRGNRRRSLLSYLSNLFH